MKPSMTPKTKRYAKIDRTVTNKFLYGQAIPDYGVDGIPNDDSVKLPIVGKKKVMSLEPDHIPQVNFNVKYG